MSKTISHTYHSEKEMNNDMQRKERSGWTVINTQRVPQGWGVAKTTLLGFIYLPLAIFGKKKDLFQVTYQQENEQPNNSLESMPWTSKRKAPKWLIILTISLWVFLCLVIVFTMSN